jgi:hypothetical protein
MRALAFYVVMVVIGVVAYFQFKTDNPKLTLLIVYGALALGLLFSALASYLGRRKQPRPPV